MKKRRGFLAFTFFVIFLFLISCEPIRSENNVIISPSVSLASTLEVLSAQGTNSIYDENIPVWCESSLANNIPIKEIEWENANSPVIISQIKSFINSSTGLNLTRYFPKLSFDGDWFYKWETKNDRRTIVNTSDGSEILIKIPTESGFLVSQPEIWSPDSKSILLLGNELPHPNASAGVLIANRISEMEIISNFFLLPDGIETHIDPIWSADSNRFGIILDEYSSINPAAIPQLLIINKDGTPNNIINLPEGILDNRFIWASDGIYFVRVQENEKRYQVNRIRLDSNNSPTELLYSSEFALSLLGVNVEGHQLLVGEGFSKSKSCFQSWDFQYEKQIFIAQIPDNSPTVFQGNDSVGINYSIHDSEYINHELFLIFDYLYGFTLIDKGFDFPLGWNSEVNGFLFIKGESPNSTIGVVKP